MPRFHQYLTQEISENLPFPSYLEAQLLVKNQLSKHQLNKESHFHSRTMLQSKQHHPYPLISRPRLPYLFLHSRTPAAALSKNYPFRHHQRTPHADLAYPRAIVLFGQRLFPLIAGKGSFPFVKLASPFLPLTVIRPTFTLPSNQATSLFDTEQLRGQIGPASTATAHVEVKERLLPINCSLQHHLIRLSQAHKRRRPA